MLIFKLKSVNGNDINKDSKFQLFFFPISTFIGEYNCHVKTKYTQMKLAQNVKRVCYMY